MFQEEKKNDQICFSLNDSRIEYVIIMLNT